MDFDEIEERVVEALSRATIAVGAVAWLTNERILTSLAKVAATLGRQGTSPTRPYPSGHGGRFRSLSCYLLGSGLLSAEKFGDRRI